MKSMTGYGRATATCGNLNLTVTVSSVNRKGLDLGISLPKDWQEIESELSELAKRQVSRGKVNLNVEASGEGGAGGFSLDEARTEATITSLRSFAHKQGLSFELSPEILWQIANSQRQSSSLPGLEQVREPLLAVAAEALQSFVAMREREGANLLLDFEARIGLLHSHLEQIAGRAPLVAGNYRELLMKRLRDAGLELDIADDRVLREVALFADRCDVTEEITRFRSHLEQLSGLLHSTGEIGRKAEFILQEMGREVNTTGSKANDITISRAVIELKNELERIREQIANVE